ncbi:hypothetical protein Pam5_14 [Pseudanabaena phage Pam5]|nr:hypothetical protein Pam5_14 [Pseudanabaena phage Pam5]
MDDKSGPILSELRQIRLGVYLLLGALVGLAIRHYGLWNFLFGAWL